MAENSENKNDIVELRKHLFDTMRDLRSKESPMDMERARTVSSTAQTIINSIKVENDFMKITGAMDGSGVIPGNKQLPAPKSGQKQIT